MGWYAYEPAGGPLDAGRDAAYSELREHDGRGRMRSDRPPQRMSGEGQHWSAREPADPGVTEGQRAGVPSRAVLA